MTDLDAVVLAGGQGTRLRPVLPDAPKALAPIAGRPFLDFLLLALRQQGVGRVVLATGYRADAFDQHLDRWRALGLEVALSREQEPLGTGGALRLALDAVQTDPFLVLNGDSHCPFDLPSLEPAPAIWLVPVDDVRPFGAVAVDAQGLVRSFREKSQTAGGGLVNAGIYLLRRADVAAVPPGRALSLERELMPGLVGRGLRGVVGAGPLVDIGTPESYAAADRLFRQRGAA